MPADLEQRAREFLTDETDWLADEFREIHREATDAERERCAKVCEALGAHECASAIRKGDPNGAP